MHFWDWMAGLVGRVKGGRGSGMLRGRGKSMRSGLGRVGNSKGVQATRDDQVVRGPAED